MKRLFPAAVLLAATLILAIMGNNNVKNICNFSKKQLQVYSDLVDDREYEKADKKAKEIKQYWEEKSKTLALYVNHGFIDEVALSLNRLSSFPSQKLSDDSASALADTKYLLNQILSEQRFSIETFY